MTDPSALRARCDLDELEKAAKAATPGPWTRSEYYVYADNGQLIAKDFVDDETAEHVAAANPAVVLELVRRLREAEGIVTAAAEVLSDVDWDEYLLANGDAPCDPATCDLGRKGEHTVLDHHSVSAGMGAMLRLKRAVDATPARGGVMEDDAKKLAEWKREFDEEMQGNCNDYNLAAELLAEVERLHEVIREMKGNARERGERD